MKKLTALAVLICFMSFSVYAKVKTSKSRAQFCADRKNKTYYQDLLADSANWLAFINEGGIGNQGVCWWHSRFTRNATYVALYRPDLQVPTEKEAKKIIDKIRKGKDVVIVPGYKNLREFSSDYHDLIQDELEAWQKGDGFLKFQWIKGLAGGSKKSAKKLKEKMDDLYQEVEVEKKVVYQKLQIKGIMAHSWLVIGMNRTINGYELHVVDSNFYSQIETYYYSEGMTHFDYDYAGRFVPYTNNAGELRRLEKEVRKFCK